MDDIETGIKKTDGKYMRITDRKEAIREAIENGQTVLYITERCVFRLTADGLELIEVYPGIDIDRDILSQMAFPVKVADNLK